MGLRSLGERFLAAGFRALTVGELLRFPDALDAARSGASLRPEDGRRVGTDDRSWLAVRGQHHPPARRRLVRDEVQLVPMSLERRCRTCDFAM